MSVWKSRSASLPRKERRKPFLPCGEPWQAPLLQPARECAAVTSLRNAPGSAGSVGPDPHLVRRLAAQHPDKIVTFLDKTVCYCATMNRIDLPHLVHSLELLAGGEVRNQITVDSAVAANARLALQAMLALA